MIVSVLLRVLVGTGNGAKLVELVLEEVGIDRADGDAMPAGELRGFSGIHAHRKIPQHMHRHGRAAAGVLMDGAGVLELLLDRAGRRRLEELAEARAGIGIAPRRGFDLEVVQQGKELIAFHGFGPSPSR